jgi:BCD family chlorophyll transporter-like MFS transporter
MNFAPAEQRGLALGAWGAVQASAAGIGIGLGGVIRDLVVALGNTKLLPEAFNGPAIGYSLVYALEIALLIATILAMMPLLRTQSIST